MHQWLVTQRHLGPYLLSYQQGRGIPLRAKIAALTMMWTSLSVSIVIVPLLWVRVLLALIGISVSIYLLRMRTLDPHELRVNQIRRE